VSSSTEALSTYRLDDVLMGYIADWLNDVLMGCVLDAAACCQESIACVGCCRCKVITCRG
jgi:hypothetical protein